jgi:hypothetical protein
MMMMMMMMVSWVTTLQSTSISNEHTDLIQENTVKNPHHCENFIP